MADDEQREQTRRDIFELLQRRETYLTFGNSEDVNRITDEISVLECSLHGKIADGSMPKGENKDV